MSDNTDGGERQGTGRLKPRARLMRMIGQDLVSSNSVAVLELVKNGYDADAGASIVSIDGEVLVEEQEHGKGRRRTRRRVKVAKGAIVEVVDNGHGMSLKTVLNDWMEPATGRKLRAKLSEAGRRVQGEKGIGRFATARIGRKLELITRRSGDDDETVLIVNWDDFDSDKTYLEDVRVVWERRSAIEICPDGAWADHVQQLDPSKRPFNSGTIVRMMGGRDEWTADDIVEVRRVLARLISPFSDEVTASFVIAVENGVPEWSHLVGRIEEPPVFSKAPYSLDAEVGKAGDYIAVLKVGDNEHEESGYVRPDLDPDGPESKRRGSNKADAQAEKLLECGPFSLRVRVWDRDAASLRQLAQRVGGKVTSVRRDLNAIAGMSVYRDSFRVLPYGEPKNDWLKLDLRRVQNPTMRISSNQLVGFVGITADENGDLRDQSNREGIAAGKAFDTLQETVLELLSKLEVLRYDYRRSEAEEDTDTAGGLFDGIQIDAVVAHVSERHPEDRELKAVVAEAKKQIEVSVKRVRTVLSRYQRLSTLGQVVDTVLHDGRGPLSKIRTRAVLLGKTAKKLEDCEELRAKVVDGSKAMLENAKLVKATFDRIEPFGGRQRGRPSRQVLESIVAESFAIMNSEIADVGAVVILPESRTEVTVEPTDIKIVLVNLIRNSCHWLSGRPEPTIQVDVSRVEGGVEMLFCDNGPGVDPKYQHRIFEAYFTTRKDGEGQGLAIVGDIVSEYYDGELSLMASGPLPGACFSIVLRRRVGS